MEAAAAAESSSGNCYEMNLSSAPPKSDHHSAGDTFFRAESNGSVVHNDQTLHDENAFEESQAGKEVDHGTAAAEREVHNARISVMRDAASRLEEILNDVKGATNRLLGEIDIFMQETEGVTVDYMRCLDSQHKEAQRLEDIEPDVAGATARFFQQAQSQLNMANETTAASGSGVGGNAAHSSTD